MHTKSNREEHTQNIKEKIKSLKVDNDFCVYKTPSHMQWYYTHMNKCCKNKT